MRHLLFARCVFLPANQAKPAALRSPVLDSPIAGCRHSRSGSEPPDSRLARGRDTSGAGVDWPQAAFKAPSLRISPDKSSY